jgi:hypothetical protein
MTQRIADDSNRIICGGGGTCERVCPIKMIGRLCPSMDELANALNIVYGLTDPQPQFAPVAA